MLVDNTPWEQYDIYYGHTAYPVWVKREDLCCGEGRNHPSFSKMRGVVEHLRSLECDGEYPTVGVLDTYHSKAGRGVAWVCNRLKIRCIVFFPVYKKEMYDGEPEWGRAHFYPPNCTVREHQRVANSMGAYLVPLKAGRSAILYHRARKILADITDGQGYMMPNALKLDETVKATSNELIRHTPVELLHKGTWIVSISSGTIAAGVVRGLYCLNFPHSLVIAHMGYSRSESAARNYILDMAGTNNKEIQRMLQLVDEGYSYKDKVENDWIPFPCNEYYDAKAFTWLEQHIPELEPPVVFWNIGE